jgi:hypothetical protein
MSNKFSIYPLNVNPINLETLEKSYAQTFDEFEHQYNPFLIAKLQNYNPIYQKIFVLNKANYNEVSLNHDKSMCDLFTVLDNKTKKTITRDVFIKFSPLLDPIRYMIGKYKADYESIRLLPKLDSLYAKDELQPHSKIIDPNNAAYTDGFFCFLTSKLAKEHGIMHGVEYYGSFLGIQEKYKMNVTDDLEYLNTSNFFNENVNKLFAITKTDVPEYMNVGSRGNKNKIVIADTDPHNNTVISVEDLNNETDDLNNTETESQELVYQKSSPQSSHTSTASSDNSKLNYSSDSDSGSDPGSDSESDEESDSSSKWGTESSCKDNMDDENQDYAFIKNFPVQLICTEKCEGTLDRLFITEKINKENGASALFQIVMILITYQKAFHFTHNDLHTNNIMYDNTDLEFLYYKYNGKYYKVPTYGKLYKLIDFGRSIYKFNGKTFCSDSFATGGDAATQYNCEPYMNENKPRLEPNYSFDLCRLGCSIYDFIIDTDENLDSFDELQKTIYRWCLDDSGKNILYKRSGEERYPNFKLYKMIARTVHNHNPEAQLEFDYFNQFLVDDHMCSTSIVMDLDMLPSYV